MTRETPSRFEKNAPGPFYGTGGCTACGTPEAEAPELLAALTDENLDTYFVRQPQSSDEVEHACRAIEVCCLAALRYAGRDPAILRRLGNRDLYCDHPLPGGPVPLAGETARDFRDARAIWRRANPRWWQGWW